MTVMFFHQVLPPSLTGFLFQGTAIVNFPFLLSLLSLMLVCQHFFLWSLIVCPASVLLPLFWQLLQTHLLLCPSLIVGCVSSSLLPLMFRMTLLRSLLEGTCLSGGPEALKRQTRERNHLEPMSIRACYDQIVFLLGLIPFPPYGTMCNYLRLQPIPCILCMLLYCQKWPGTKMEWGL